MQVSMGSGISGKVVRLAARVAQRPADPALAQLRAYWEALRAEARGVPARAQIDPRGIGQALDHAFIAERAAPGVAIFRLAGMHLNDLMGMEVRGMPLTTFFEPASRDEAARQIELAMSAGSAVELRLEGERGLGRPALAAQMLLLPLRDEAGRGHRLLGGLAAEGPAGRAPRRFRLLAAERSLPRAVNEAVTAVAATPQTPTWPSDRLAPGHHLRLVHSRAPDSR